MTTTLKPAQAAKLVSADERARLFDICQKRYSGIDFDGLSIRLGMDSSICLRLLGSDLTKVAKRIILEETRAGRLECVRESEFRPGFGNQAARYRRVEE